MQSGDKTKKKTESATLGVKAKVEPSVERAVRVPEVGVPEVGVTPSYKAAASGSKELDLSALVSAAERVKHASEVRAREAAAAAAAQEAARVKSESELATLGAPLELGHMLEDKWEGLACTALEAGPEASASLLRESWPEAVAWLDAGLLGALRESARGVKALRKAEKATREAAREASRRAARRACKKASRRQEREVSVRGRSFAGAASARALVLKEAERRTAARRASEREVAVRCELEAVVSAWRAASGGGASEEEALEAARAAAGPALALRGGGRRRSKRNRVVVSDEEDEDEEGEGEGEEEEMEEEEEEMEEEGEGEGEDEEEEMEEDEEEDDDDEDEGEGEEEGEDEDEEEEEEEEDDDDDDDDDDDEDEGEDEGDEDEEEGGFPTTDVRALEKLAECAGADLRAVDGKNGGEETLWVFRQKRGLWSCRKSAFLALCQRHRDELGPKYGQMLRHMKSMFDMSHADIEHLPTVSYAWTQQLDKPAAGLVPFKNGLYNIATRQRRDFRDTDLLTVKFDFDAPRAGERYMREKAFVKQMLQRLFPENALREEVMKRVAQSFFEGKPHVGKYFLQLYGPGDNGKSTFIAMLRIAFPAWVVDVPVHHFLFTGHRTDANAPQPWKLDVMGARIVTCEEPPPDKYGGPPVFDGNLLKLLRGGGTVTGRTLYRTNVTYDPTYRVVICLNTPLETNPQNDPAVIKSIHAFSMPSKFVAAGSPELHNAQPGDHCYAKIDDVQSRFTQRKYKLALFAVLIEYYDLYKQNPDIDTVRSGYDMRDKYEVKSDAEFFDACFDVLPSGFERPVRFSDRELYDTLRKKTDYDRSYRDFQGWVSANLGKKGKYKHMETRNHSGTKKWTHLALKGGAAGPSGLGVAGPSEDSD